MRSKIVGLIVGQFRASLLRTLFYSAEARHKVIVGPRARIVGARRIRISGDGRLALGVGYCGFLHGHERSILRIRGELHLDGPVSIGAGNSWDIGPGAVVSVGARTYFSPNSLVIAMHEISFGEGCAISWGSQFLDDDFHALVPDGVTAAPNSGPIRIGNRVWVGSGVKVYKGVTIADGCVVAGGAVVTRSVTEPNSLIAGVPAKVVQSDIGWRLEPL